MTSRVDNRLDVSARTGLNLRRSCSVTAARGERDVDVAQPLRERSQYTSVAAASLASASTIKLQAM